MIEIFSTFPLEVVADERGMDIGPGLLGANTETALSIYGWRVLIATNQSLSRTAEVSHGSQGLFH
jgi:hypothetical protein